MSAQRSAPAGRRGASPIGDEALSVAGLVAAEVFVACGSSPEGLTTAEATHRLAIAGPNVITRVAPTPLVRAFAANFTHLMALLLWGAGGIALTARMPELAVAIWLVNVINGIFSFWQEYKAEKATEALRRLLPQAATAVRDGQEQRVPAETLVPGDLLVLRAGDRISADARIVWEAELRVDQSTLTGEAHPVRKTADPVLRTDLARLEIPNLVFAGTVVAAGTGRAIVVATGMRTEFGKIAHLTQTMEAGLSPLQRELAHVTRTITVIAVAVGLLFFLLAVTLVGIDLAQGFIFAMGMIVAFVPEGLLPTVSLALAMGVQRMAGRHALVKRLSAVETLGCTTVICTDKTGTLTQNAMTVRGLWCGGRRFEVTGTGYAPVGQILHDGRPVNPPPADVQRLLRAAGLCTNARLLPPDAQEPVWRAVGDPTEAALRVVAAKAGVDLATEERRAPRVRELAFDSRRKRMTTVHRCSDTLVAFTKGAPRELLALCSRLRTTGQDVPLDDAARAEIVATIDAFASAGHRVLGVATRALPPDCERLDAEAVERDLTFLGLTAMMDPPRPEVADAVALCQRAGIRVVMVTGDYGLTAESIARRIGIVRTARPRIVTGPELDAMDDAALHAALCSEVIFARVTPEHKLRIVAALQAAGEVVAVTGDGVNDAPALKKADIGVAMGLSGTDVAREAADVILTDDNFASIVHAVEEGRAIYANIKKFTTYIFTSNTPEAVPFILFALSRGRIPLALNVMHILSIDLGTDLVPALALGGEPPEPGVMDRPPRDPRDHVVTPALLLRAYLWLGPLQAAAAMAAFYFHYWTHGYAGRWLDLPATGEVYRAATAMALSAVVSTQVGNLFAQRTERTSVFRVGLTSNRLVWPGIAAELALIVLIVYAPPLQRIVGTAVFPPSHWLFVAAWMPSLLVIDEVRKALVRRREARVRPAALRATRTPPPGDLTSHGDGGSAGGEG